MSGSKKMGRQHLRFPFQLMSLTIMLTSLIMCEFIPLNKSQSAFFEKKRSSGDISSRFSKFQLTRKDLNRYSIYRERGFDVVPEHFDKAAKAPCWRSSDPFPLQLLMEMAVRGEARAMSRGTQLPAWLKPYLRQGVLSSNSRRLSFVDEKVPLGKVLRKGIPDELGFLCLPYFFLLGVAKSGTTALYEMIAAHPQVVRTRKEPHWWTRAPLDDSLLHYVLTNYFGASKSVEVQSGRLVFGDASASTFWQLHHKADNMTIRWPTVPNMIRAITPHAKLIVVFRNPTERALSEFAYFIEDEHSISEERFTRACKAHIDEFNSCRKRMVGVSKDDVLECMYFQKAKRNVRMGFVRLAYGIYSRPLLYWWTVFPRAQLLVLRSETLRASPVVTLRSVLKHLDLDPLPMAQLVQFSTPAKSNKRSSDRSLKMPPLAKKLLDEFYQPFNVELAALMKDGAYLWADSYSMPIAVKK